MTFQSGDNLGYRLVNPLSCDPLIVWATVICHFQYCTLAILMTSLDFKEVNHLEAKKFRSTGPLVQLVPPWAQARVHYIPQCCRIVNVIKVSLICLIFKPSTRALTCRPDWLKTLGKRWLIG